MFKTFTKYTLYYNLIKQKLFKETISQTDKFAIFILEKQLFMSNEFVFIRNIFEEERIQIKFEFPPEKLISNHEFAAFKPRTFNFDRSKSEEISVTLQRISSSISKVINLKRKRKNKSEEVKDIEINVKLLNESEPIADTIANKDVWTNNLILVICDICYRVKLNPPTITLLQLPKIILSGFPINPIIVTEFSLEMQPSVRWYIEEKIKYVNKDPEKHANRVKDHLKYKLISEKPLYVPSDEDVGLYLKVECILDSESYSAISNSEIVEGPKSCPFEKRQKDCQPITDRNSFRILCYNVLADVYADQDFSKEYLFPYCPEHFIKFDYRRHLLKKEIFGYNADIFCLQEVDKKFFEMDLLPSAKIYNFDGLLKLKSGDVAEGSATFFNQSKFQLMSRHDICLADVYKNAEYVEDIRTEVDKNELFRSMVLERSTILQSSIFRCVDDSRRKIMVATTHLYFHPKAAHVRLVQFALIFKHLQHIMDMFEADDKPKLILCGDFNSSPTTSLHEFIRVGSLPASHADWYIGGKTEYAGFPLSHSFKLANACGQPAYTNYVAGFRACIDFIYAEEGCFDVTRVIPMPNHEDVVRHTALPNQIFPSDHLAIGCTLRWGNK